MKDSQESLKIIPKEKPKTPLLLKGLFAFFIIAISGLAVVYFVLSSQTSGLEEEGLKIDEQIIKLQAEQIREKRKEVAALAAQLADFKQILESRKLAAPIFDLLRDICHPKTQFLTFSFNQKSGQLYLEAATESFETLSQQLQILRLDLEGWPEAPISQAEVSDISLDQDGSVKFNLSFNLNPAFLELALE